MPKWLMRFALLLLLATAMLLAASGCGGGRPAPEPSASFAAPRAALDLPAPPPDASRLVHRAPTWQNTRNFTAGVDYYDDQILVLFADELAEGSVRTGAGIGQPSLKAGSLLFENIEHAQFARQLADDCGLAILESCEAYVPGFNFCGFQLPAGANAEALMQRLLDENPYNVRLVEYNPIYRALYTPDDPKVQDGTQWFHNATHMDDYGAWDTQTGSSDVYIAIVDSGADMDHPDLAGNILDLEALWPGEDFDLGESDRWPQDNVGHGSHCAGIAAAAGDNTTGGAGVAYGCKLLPIKVTNSSGYFVASINGIVLAVQCGASVVSMSFGSYLPSETLKEACEYAYLNGTLPVAAAGNDNNSAQIHYPAGVPVCVATGAVNSSDNKASFSNYGVWVDIAAPGVDIYSTVPNNTYDTYQGTSMASPMVAGAAALLLSEYGDSLSLDQIRGLLESSGDALTASQWGNDYILRVNTANALAATAGEAPTVDITNLENDATVTGEVAIECSVTDDGAIERAFLYIDGVLVDQLYDPGMDFTFTYNATDEYPNELNIEVEVIDDDCIHAFDERVVIVADSFIMPVPYYEDFDEPSAEHWTQFNLSGEAYWHLYEETPGDFALRLGDPALTPPMYRQRDVDWLFSPLLDLRGVSQAMLVFDGDWSFSWSKPMYLVVQGEVNGQALYFSESTFDGWAGLNLEDLDLTGQIIQVFWMLDGNDAGGQRWFQFDEFYLAVPTELPMVFFYDPSEGGIIDGEAPLDVRVYDDFPWQVDRLEIFADGALVATTHYPDWGATLDTSAYPTGPLQLSATAYEYDLYDNDGENGTEDRASATCNAFVGHHHILNFSPPSGFYYDEVAIYGGGFGEFGEGLKRVTFAGADTRLEAPIVYWLDTAICVTVPLGTVNGPIAVEIDGVKRESADWFVLVNPYDDFDFAFEDAPPNLMFVDDFAVRVFAQPDLDSITIRIAGEPGKEWSAGTRGNDEDILQLVDIGGLTTGAYMLEVEGFAGAYSETIGKRFYLNTLPGDFNSDAVVDALDTDYLRTYIDANGEVAEGAPEYMPFLDSNADGLINEADAGIVGFHFGDTLL